MRVKRRFLHVWMVVVISWNDVLIWQAIASQKVIEANCSPS